MCTLLVEYVPSLHSAVAPAGAPAGARTVGIWDEVALPEVGAAGVGAGLGAGVAAGAVPSHCATPPWAEQAPFFDLAEEYEPSPQRAVALAGAVPLVGRAEGVLDVDVEARDGLAVGAVVCFDDAVERLELVDRVDGFLAETSEATPPWPEHRPCDAVAVE